MSVDGVGRDTRVGEGERYSDRRGLVGYGACRILGDDEDELLGRLRPAYAQVFFGDPSVNFHRRSHVWFAVASYRRISWPSRKSPPERTACQAAEGRAARATSTTLSALNMPGALRRRSHRK